MSSPQPSREGNAGMLGKQRSRIAAQKTILLLCLLSWLG